MSEGRNSRFYLLWIGLAAALLAALFASGALTGLGGPVSPPEDPARLRAAREQHLMPIQTLLRENGGLSSELRRRFVEYPGGIQESYFAKIVRDGAAKHNEMQAMIDRLNRNNLTILAHLRAYGEPLTEDLKEQAAFFREHAERYDQRWKALPQAAAKGEEPPVAQPMFPPGFPRAVAVEMAAIDEQARR